MFDFVLKMLDLQNLLIAMMTDRFTKINSFAEVEWRLINARLVKEHFGAYTCCNTCCNT